ncbi:Uncharacterized protein TCM_027053 [Theobroma cacao]|uniref:DUF4220 domain-containing protein n=1 Tax=Theobroma cacao TaxID=3641 RepID=A0A061G772_THECC|nr:Uncharacterized protein TCM_027053 [Theobroma cacao]
MRDLITVAHRGDAEVNAKPCGVSIGIRGEECLSRPRGDCHGPDGEFRSKAHWLRKHQASFHSASPLLGVCTFRANKRPAMTIVETVLKLWHGWEIRVLVLLSLSLQVILVAFGSKRKSTASTWVKVLVWSTYMSADWVATVALGVIARSLGNNIPMKHPLQSFWALFLLLHLGGPDTITAYSLEDNELWLRHFLGLVFQTGVAIYILLRSSFDSDTTFFSIAMPVFIAGIIKYGERTYVLMSSSTKRFRTSLFSEKNFTALTKDNDVENSVTSPVDGTFLLRVDFFFKRLKVLFADFILDRKQGHLCNNMIRCLKPDEAFQLVEFELGLLYDLLYTKATLVHSCFGIFLRCITCLASVSALVTFSIIIDEHKHFPVDISVTYFLLVGAVVLEVYALFMLACSDWTKLSLVGKETCFSLKRMTRDKRWSRSIARYNLMKFCLKKEGTKCIKVGQLLGIYEKLEKHRNVEWQQGIDDDLKCLIFDQLGNRLQKPEDLSNAELCKKVLNYRGECVLDELKWSTTEVEFDESILLWHIATQLCYHDDNRTQGFSSLNACSKISRCLSEYMLYLVVMCPNMLPKGFGYIRYKKACEEVIDFFGRKRDMQMEEACKELLERGTNILQGNNIMEKLTVARSKPVILSKGCILAKQLQNLKPPNQARKEKWDMMNKVWVELLTYAAGHCGWKEHAQHLASGGQLLTHVCLLMAHFGISGQFQDKSFYFLQLPSVKPSKRKTWKLYRWIRYINCYKAICKWQKTSIPLSVKILNYKGDCVLDEMKCLELLKWSTIDVEFDESILLKHIATQLCYHDAY